MKENIIAVVAVLALVLSAVALVGGQSSPVLPVVGGATNYDIVDTTDGYYVDGSSIINGSGVFVGAVSGTSGAFSGATSLSSTLGVTATTTLSDTVQFQNPQGICINLYATSSATAVKLVASSTAQIISGLAATSLTENAGVMLLQYGSCKN